MRGFAPIFLANIFLSLHYAVILYVNSTYLGRFFDAGMVSMLFLAGAGLNILLFIAIPKLVCKLGLKALYLLLVAVTGVSILGLAFSLSAISAGIFFVVYMGTLILIYYTLDIFLEDVSLNSRTGAIRGSYLTFGNAAIAAGSLLLSLIVAGEELLPAYFAAAFLLVPLFAIGFVLRKVRAVKQKIHPGFLPFSAWWRADSVRRATLARLVLEIFYAFMIIYTPIYLHSVLGFGWTNVGLIFTIMLLPFVLFGWPIGVLVDKRWGEKEIMSLGFFIAGSSLLLMPFLAPVFIVWAAVLFLSRIGASFIEVATESYFFKHVDARDSAIISIFRLARPVGIIIGSVLGATTLAFFSFDKIFFVLALIVFLGLRESLYLKDTL